MPLFFIIPIAAGALTLGATAVDITGDNQEVRAHQQQTQYVQQPQSPPQQSQVQTQIQNQAQAQGAQGYRSLAECQQAAAQRGMPATVCHFKP